MPNTTTTQPYEILVRFRQGKVSGAHIQHIVETVNENGILLGGIPLEPRPLGEGGNFPLDQAMNEAQKAALLGAEQARDETKTLQAASDKMKLEMGDQIEALKTRATDLETQLTEVTATKDNNLAFYAEIVGRAKTALADGKITPEERTQLLDALFTEATKPIAQRQAEALESEIAQKTQALEELRKQTGQKSQ